MVPLHAPHPPAHCAAAAGPASMARATQTTAVDMARPPTHCIVVTLYVEDAEKVAALTAELEEISAQHASALAAASQREAALRLQVNAATTAAQAMQVCSLPHRRAVLPANCVNAAIVNTKVVVG